ncbi:MAG TPA: imidazole glycerol phosphate synthase subunit HisH [Taishania sp.]|nr:imidazole glycerol phosphate synthase subunit HisH [Taishania sp.]HNS42574.1 imidazole glycerol phosphate synthase subunit HisH [Taishania sp.]
MTIAIINYGMGNLFSIEKRLKRMGVETIVASNAADLMRADKFILPGVGHFGKAMQQLQQLDLVEPLQDLVLQQKKPILGICLGMQLLANYSEEGETKGLGWINADVKRFQINDSKKYKIPHTGWNEVIPQKSSPLFENCAAPMEFYFVHSYYFNCAEEQDVLAISNHEKNFVCAVQKNNIFGVQFHPEKSHEIGNTLLRNFVNY